MNNKTEHHIPCTLKDEFEKFRKNRSEHSEFVESKIEEIKNMVTDLKENINWIEIKNGGNKQIKIDRQDFHQGTYDILHFKGLTGWIIKIAGLVLIVLQILNLFK